jgi:hypothetical protein
MVFLESRPEPAHHENSRTWNALSAYRTDNVLLIPIEWPVPSIFATKNRNNVIPVTWSWFIATGSSSTTYCDSFMVSVSKANLNMTPFNVIIGSDYWLF